MMKSSIDRAFHHDMLTFSFFYAFSENFILPISHDEVVHGKASLVNKMYGGDIDNKFKQCKLFMAYMMAHPGKKLLFMGADFAQFREWDYENGLEWFMVDEYENHRNYLNYSKNLNHFYLDHPQFWERDFSWEGFSWISNDDFKQSIIIDVLTKTAERSSWFATSFLWKESHTALAFLTGAAIQRCSTRLLLTDPLARTVLSRR